LAEIELLRTKIASSELPERHQAAVWLLLATGARVGELAKARWGDINITDKTWKIPAENSKNGREHLIHLSAFSISQLSALEQYRDGSYLLPGQIRKKRIEAAGSTERIELPISEKTISKAIRDRIRSEPLKRRTRRTQTLLLPGGEWSPHDLRRTMASRMGDLGIAPHIIERCLNHVQQGIVGVYQRQEYLPERKAAFEKWGRRLARILGAREEDNA
jgi:integrase